MPLFQYRCPQCENEFDALIPAAQRDVQKCTKCGASAERKKVTGFAVNSTADAKNHVPYSEKEIDLVVGASTEQKWQEHEERVRARRQGMVEIAVDPKSMGGGKFNPQEILGKKEQRELGKINSEAFQAHRAERIAKGIPQFAD